MRIKDGLDGLLHLNRKLGCKMLVGAGKPDSGTGDPGPIWFSSLQNFVFLRYKILFVSFFPPRSLTFSSSILSLPMASSNSNQLSNSNPPPNNPPHRKVDCSFTPTQRVCQRCRQTDGEGLIYLHPADPQQSGRYVCQKCADHYHAKTVARQTERRDLGLPHFYLQKFCILTLTHQDLPCLPLHRSPNRIGLKETFLEATTVVSPCLCSSTSNTE